MPRAAGPRAAVATLLALLAAGAGGPAAAAPAPAPAKSVFLRDPPCGDSAFDACDCLSVRATPGESGLAFEVLMAATPDPRLFTCVHVYIDADRDEDTGIHGHELWFRAAVGSRFGTGDAGPAPPTGTPPGRLAWSGLGSRETIATKEKEDVWLNYPLPGSPVVDGHTIRFTIPRDVLEKVEGGGGAPFDFKVQVETWTGKRPLVVDHVSVDEGLPIVVDGDDREWSGALEARDPVGEFFGPMRHLDIRRLRVDHGPNAIFVCLDLDREGLADPVGKEPDVGGKELITLFAEPLDSDYQKPHRLEIPRGQPEGATKEGSWAVRGRTVEASLPSAGLDGRVRVLAWSEGWRRDKVPDRGYARISMGGK